MFDDVGGIDVFEGRHQLEVDVAKHAAEGCQHVHAKAQPEGKRGDAAHALDEQRDDQPHAQEKELEDDDAHQQQQERRQVVFPPAAEKRESNEGWTPKPPGW